MNILEEYGIRHLSASSINKWMGDRGSWVAQYIYGIKGQMGPAVFRGSAVENGLTAYVTEANEDPLTFARRSYANDIFRQVHGEDFQCSSWQAEIEDICEADDVVAKHYGLIEAMLDQAKTAWDGEELGKPVATQIKTTLWIDGISVPVIGYADFVMDGYCLDLKTTERLPSKPSHMHAIQATGYARARDEQYASLLYITGKKSAHYQLGLDEIRETHADMRQRALGLQSTLRAAYADARGDIAKAREIIAEMCPPDVDSFYWNDRELNEARERITAWQ
ncbi:MAG: hypothetical protein AAFQ22_13225 [Pseudomonadota bacterium]